MAKSHALTYYADRRKLYKAYIQSKEWKELRARVIHRDGGKCTKCGSTVRLHVHHEHYITFGSEDIGDLRTLCEDCHNIHHGGSPRGMGRRARVKAAAAKAAVEDTALTPRQRRKAQKRAAYKATVRRAERAAKLAAIERIKELDRMTLAEIRRQVKARQAK